MQQNCHDNSKNSLEDKIISYSSHEPPYRDNPGSRCTAGDPDFFYRLPIFTSKSWFLIAYRLTVLMCTLKTVRNVETDFSWILMPTFSDHANASASYCAKFRK